jgi:hypothetical protein
MITYDHICRCMKKCVSTCTAQIWATQDIWLGDFHCINFNSLHLCLMIPIDCPISQNCMRRDALYRTPLWKPQLWKLDPGGSYTFSCQPTQCHIFRACNEGWPKLPGTWVSWVGRCAATSDPEGGVGTGKPGRCNVARGDPSLGSVVMLL